jgi:hypothetical protein
LPLAGGGSDSIEIDGRLLLGLPSHSYPFDFATRDSTVWWIPGLCCMASAQKNPVDVHGELAEPAGLTAAWEVRQSRDDEIESIGDGGTRQSG